MKRYIAIGLLFLCLLVLAACANETVILSESKTYEITSEIHSLDIQINAADFIIERGDTFSVESNLKYLSVSEKDGVLTVVDKQKYGIHGTDYTEASLKLCVPNNIVFEKVDITTGAARLTADSLSANSMELKLGAGKVQFGCLTARSNINIEGGTGEIVIISGTLNNLTLALGVGKLDMTATLLGDSNLEFGVGESNLALIGSKDDYKIDIEKGIGSISVDGEEVSDFSWNGNGQNQIEIEGGIGSVNIVFQAE